MSVLRFSPSECPQITRRLPRLCAAAYRASTGMCRDRPRYPLCAAGRSCAKVANAKGSFRQGHRQERSEGNQLQHLRLTFCNIMLDAQQNFVGSLTRASASGCQISARRTFRLAAQSCTVKLPMTPRYKASAVSVWQNLQCKRDRNASWAQLHLHSQPLRTYRLK